MTSLQFTDQYTKGLNADFISIWINKNPKHKQVEDIRSLLNYGKEIAEAHEYMRIHNETSEIKIGSFHDWILQQLYSEALEEINKIIRIAPPKRVEVIGRYKEKVFESK